MTKNMKKTMSGTPRTIDDIAAPSSDTGATGDRAAVAPRNPKASATGAVTASKSSTVTNEP
jgi:hypothetical protein